MAARDAARMRGACTQGAPEEDQMTSAYAPAVDASIRLEMAEEWTASLEET